MSEAAPPRRLLAFDSGIGGLGIVRALRARLPTAEIAYLADNAVYPYGELPDATLVARVGRLLAEALPLVTPDAVVVACNTASTVALDALRRRFPLPFIGCVPPIKWAAAVSRTRHLGLLATAGTVRRAYLRDLMTRFAPDCTLIAHGARGLADLAEARFRGETVSEAAIRRELGLLFAQPGGERIDTVALGCTHYGFLIDGLRAASPHPVAWLDPADAVARQAALVLAAAPLAPERGHREGDLPPGEPWERTAFDVRRALFTAPPRGRVGLEAGLARYGYDGLVVHPLADGSAPAAPRPADQRARWTV